METDPHTVSKWIGLILILLSLVTPFAGLAEFDGGATQLAPKEDGDSNAPKYQIEEFSVEDQETVRKAIQCDGDLTVYGSGWSSLPAPFDERYTYAADGAKYGSVVTYQGDTYQLSVGFPALWGPIIPRALVVIKSLAFLAIGYLFFSYANTAQNRGRRREGWILSLVGVFLILALLWIGNYQYYILTPVSC